MPGDSAGARSNDLTWTVGAILLVLALYADVSSSFTPVRIRLVPQRDAAAATVSLPLTDAWRIAEPWLIATYRVRNSGPTGLIVESRVGSDVLQRTMVAGMSSARVRVVWPRPKTIPRPYALLLSGRPSDWVVESAELSNRHGFSSGLLNLSVVPAAQSFPRMPLSSVLAFTLVIIATSRVEPAALAGWRRLLARWGGLVAVVLLTAVVVAPALSAFAFVLSPRTFALCVTLLSAPRLVAVWRAGSASCATAGVRARLLSVAAWGGLAAAFIVSAMLQLLAGYDGNYSGFLHLSREVAARAPFLQERPELARSLVQYDRGYDGQFMYLMAFDPLLVRFKAQPRRYRDVTDTPPYRYGRIGFSALTRLLSAERPERFPAAMMWLIIGAHFGLACGLASLAWRHGLAPGTALLYLAIPGFMASMVFALPEALVAAALVMGLVCLEANQMAGAGICFATAVLMRETSVVMVVGLSVASAGRVGWRRSAIVFLEAFLPLAAWRAYVGWRLMPDFGAAAFVGPPGVFAVPFAGLSHLVRAGMSGSQARPEVAAALVFPFIVTGGLALSLWLLRRQPGPLQAATAAYGVMAVSLNYTKVWSHVPSGERGTFELFLGLLLILLVTGAGDRRARRVSLAFFAALCAYTFIVSPEAGVSRAALLLIR